MAQQSPTIILNPASGQGSSSDRLKDITRAAKSLGWQGVIIQTTPDKLATVAVESELAKGQRRFVVCGGDGTIAEAVQALVGKEAFIGIVPLGTGNLLAKNLHLPIDDLGAAMKIALHGNPVKIDVGQANDVYFTIMAGMGIDAQIMQQADRKLKNTFGQFAYYWTALKRIHDAPIAFRIEVDGRKRTTKAKTVLVANMGRISKTLEAVPHTRKDDGILQIGVVRASTALQILDLLVAALKGNVGQSGHYKLIRGKKIKITPLKSPQPFQCDGNNYPATDELNITIHPQSISIMTARET